MATESLSPPVLACACASLRRAARAVTRLYERELRDSGGGLKVTQFMLLQALEIKGPSPQKGLGELLALDATTLSRTLRPLERSGWIHAGEGADRRVVRWSLTPAGRRRLARAQPGWERAQARLRAELPVEHWEALVGDLAAVAGAARRA
jgi:DNA-binding MarR family transcriptional regulator